MGANPLVSHGSLITLPRLGEEMRDIVARGGRVVVVDPVRTQTAAEFEHVRIRPNTDAWLLAAMLHVVFAKGLHDQAFLDAHTRGTEHLVGAVAAVTPELAESATGIEAETITELAVSYASAGSATGYSRCGLGRYPGASVATYLLDALNIVTGNLDRAGGMVFGDAFIDLAGFARKFGLAGMGKFAIRATGATDNAGLLPWVLPQEIEHDGQDALRALIVVAGNPALSAPGVAAFERTLAKLDLHVSIDIYPNETNRHADYILPAAIHLEREDFPVSFLAHMPKPWLQYGAKVVEPPPGVRPDWKILDDICGRMALGAPFRQRSVRLIGRVLRKVGVRITPTMLIDAMFRLGRSGFTRKRLLAQPHGVMTRPHVRVGRLAKHLPGGRVDLGSPDMLNAVRELPSGPRRLNTGQLLLVGRRQPRSLKSWLKRGIPVPGADTLDQFRRRRRTRTPQR